MEHATKSRRRRFTIEERARYVELYWGSGLTKRAFARRHGFHEVTLHHWLRRGKRGDTSHPPAFQEMGLPALASGWATEIIALVIRQLRPPC